MQGGFKDGLNWIDEIDLDPPVLGDVGHRNRHISEIDTQKSKNQDYRKEVHEKAQIM
jgi:hypothetical protein